jgi:hypothetical protein
MLPTDGYHARPVPVKPVEIEKTPLPNAGIGVTMLNACEVIAMPQASATSAWMYQG